jgi:hypothetical protein
MNKYGASIRPAVLIAVPFACLFALASAQTGHVRTGATTFEGWKSDAPGVRRHIRPSDLPPAVTGQDPEGSIGNTADVTDSPRGAVPKVPDGFAVQVFATGFNQPPHAAPRAERRHLSGGERRRASPRVPR